MQILLMLLKRSRTWVAGAILAAVLSNLSQMVHMLCVGELVNRIQGRNEIGMQLLALLGVLLISNVVTQFLNQFVGRVATEKMAHELRMGCVRNVLTKSASGDAARDVASSMSVMQNELAASNAYLENTFFDAAGMLIAGVLSFVFLFFQSFVLTLVLLLPTILISTYAAFSSKKLSGIVNAMQEEKVKMNHVAYAALHALPAVKTYDGGPLCEEAFEKSLLRWEKHAAREGRFAALFNTLSGILSKIPLLLLFLTGASMVIRGQLLLGTLIVFLNLQKSVTVFVMNLPNWLSGFKVFTANLSRIEVE